MVVFRITDAPGEGEIAVPPVFGFGKSKGTCLAHVQAMFAVIARNEFPACVLEDDAVRVGEGWPDLPEGVDWLWAGLSRWWLPMKHDRRFVQGKPVRDRMPCTLVLPGIYRADRMLATHAVIYANAGACERMIAGASLGALEGRPVDVGLHQVCVRNAWRKFALASPLFVQGGGNSLATSTRLPEGGLQLDLVSLAGSVAANARDPENLHLTGSPVAEATVLPGSLHGD